MKTLEDCHLYTFVDTGYLCGRSPTAIARELCDGGADLIQLRAKAASAAEITHWGRELLPITQSSELGLVINDFPEVAADVGAPFCHLGQEDFFDSGYTQVDQLLSRLTSHDPRAAHHVPLRIGLSSHAPAQAERALAAGACYVAVGPVFPTGTKPDAKAVGLEYVRWAAAHVHVPWFAIGGITLENVDAVLAAGATRICVVSAILSANNVAEACHRFKERLVSAARNAN